MFADMTSEGMGTCTCACLTWNNEQSTTARADSNSYYSSDRDVPFQQKRRPQPLTAMPGTASKASALQAVTPWEARRPSFWCALGATSGTQLR